MGRGVPVGSTSSNFESFSAFDGSVSLGSWVESRSFAPAKSSLD